MAACHTKMCRSVVAKCNRMKLRKPEIQLAMSYANASEYLAGMVALNKK